MDRGTRIGILRNSALYGSFAVLLLWLIYFNDLTMGDLGGFLPPLPEQLASLSVSVLLIPLLASVSVFYAASIFSAAFEGPFNELLVGSLYAAGFAVFFALFLIYSGSGMLSSTGYLFLAAFAVLLVYNSLSTLSRVWKVHALKAVAASGTIYAVGQIAIRLLALLIGDSGASLPELADALNEMLNLGFTVAAVVCLLSVLKASRNALLSVVGGIASHYLLIVSASLGGSLYFNYFRGRLTTISPGIANLSPYIEWTAICIVAALVFTRTRKGMQTSMTAKAQLGDWMRHVQDVSTYKGDRFVGFIEMIDDFIEGGRRDRLLVRLTMFLQDTGMGDEEASQLLSELINYEDERRPIFSIRGRIAAIEEGNEERRREVLWSTINRILPISLGGSAGLRGIDDEGADLLTVAPNVNQERAAGSVSSTNTKMEGTRNEG